MNIDTVIAELINVLKEFQTMLGHDDADCVTSQTRPHGGLKGFQSDLTPTIVRKVAKKLGEPLPDGVDLINIFVSDDKQRKLTVEEAAKRFSDRYSPKGASDERPGGEEKDHREPASGSTENGGAYAGAGCFPDGAPSADDL
jgi:hypothetical protein